MSLSKQKNKQKLNALYGIDFPDSLFWLHEFIVKHPIYRDTPNVSSIGFNPADPLQLLLNFDDVSDAKFVEDVLLHWRYYRDVPEFFTCFLGEGDGEHWGMLLDEPSKGFCGAASYYNNDGDMIHVYQSLFDAILTRCEQASEYYEEETPSSEAEEQEYQEIVDRNQRFKIEFESFLGTNSLSRNEGRPSGLSTSTGLDIILPDDFHPQVHEEAIAMLKTGRELWYCGGKSKCEEAFNLMRQAYESLGRYELIRILEVHFHYRDIPHVDLSSKRGKV